MNQQSKTTTTKKATTKKATTKKATTKKATTKKDVSIRFSDEEQDKVLEAEDLRRAAAEAAEAKALSRNGYPLYDITCEHYYPPKDKFFFPDLCFSLFGKYPEGSVLIGRYEAVRAIPTIAKMCKPVGAEWYFSVSTHYTLEEVTKRAYDGLADVLEGLCNRDFYGDSDCEIIIASNGIDGVSPGNFAKRSAAELAILHTLRVDTAMAPILTRDDVSREEVIKAFRALFTNKVFSGIKFSDEVIEVPHYK